MNFGNWSIMEQGVINNSNPFERIIIYRAVLDKTIYADSRTFYYWLINIVKSKNLTNKDVKDFNQAFLYSCGKFKLEILSTVYNDSLEKQERFFNLRRIENLLDCKKRRQKSFF